ncbi:MAG: hypothetical protein RL410_1544 [Actinomycetota bacterium]
MAKSLTLNYQEAVHVTGFLRRLRDWDSTAVVRIQTRGKVVAFWASTPMDCLAFIAVPLAQPVEEDIDTVVFVARLRDIFGDLSNLTDDNRVASYLLPDDLPAPLNLQELPPSQGWIVADQQTCGSLKTHVDDAIAEFHRQVAQVPHADDKLRDFIATEIWKRPGVASFPVKGLHAARLLGFLSIENARTEIASNGKWKRLITPAGQVFFDSEPKKPSLRVISVKR